MKATRFEMLGDDGEWHEVPGIVSVEIEPAAEEQARAPQSLDAFDYGYLSVMRAAGRVIDEEGNPVVPQPDRPAWQSPYGPPTRRY